MLLMTSYCVTLATDSRQTLPKISYLRDEQTATETAFVRLKVKAIARSFTLNDFSASFHKKIEDPLEAGCN